MAKRVKAVPIEQFCGSIINWYETFNAKSTADAMRRLARQVQSLPGVKSTEDLNEDMISAFVKLRRNDGRLQNTIIGELGRLKAFCNFAVRRKVLEECPFQTGQKLLRPEPSRKLTHLEIQELSRLTASLRISIEEAKGLDKTKLWAKRVSHNFYLGNEWRARRTYASIGTFSLTGARKCEVLFCWKEDLDFDLGIMKISAERKRLKTPKSHRRVPMVPQLRAILEEWLPYSGPSNWLFPGARMGGPWMHGGPGYKPLDVIRKACTKAGIEGGHIHLFRHTWLTHAEGWGIPEDGARRITGLTQAKTQEYYVHREAQHLHDLVRGVSLPELLIPQLN